MVLYLNEAWQPGDGGELALYIDDKQYCIEPVAKRLLLFRSDKVPHEVLETHKDRYSLTGWFLYMPPGLGFIA